MFSILRSLAEQTDCFKKLSILFNILSFIITVRITNLATDKNILPRQFVVSDISGNWFSTLYNYFKNFFDRIGTYAQ